MSDTASTTEVRFIRAQLRAAIEGDAWHGPSVHEAIAPFDAGAACAAVADGVHTPCELVMHIAVWIDVARRRIGGEPYSPSEAQDWPVPGGSAVKAWAAARDHLHATHLELDSAIAGMTDADLLRPVPGRDHDMRFMLHGVVQHTIYHAGQLMLLGCLAARAKGQRPKAKGERSKG